MRDETTVVREFLPGDNIGMVVEVSAPANLGTIKAMFRKQDAPEGVLVLSGERISASELRDGRLSRAILTKDSDWSTKQLPAGDYWLGEIRAETCLKKPVTVEYTGRLCLRCLPEPKEVSASITRLEFLE